MAFTYVSPVVSNLVTCSGTPTEVREDFLAGVEAALVAAGWTATDVYATSTFTFSGVPADTNTIVIGGKTYTWQAVLTNVDGNVFIGASVAACIVNIVAAVTLGAGSGTLYAAATTANTVATAASSGATTVLATAIGADQYTNLGAATTATGAYGSWSSATLIAAGSRFLSPEDSDDFGQFRIITRVNSLATTNNIFIDIATRDGANVAEDVGIIGGNGSDSPGLVSGNAYRMIASPASLAIFLPGTFNSDGTTFFFNAPAIPLFQRGKKIVSASNTSPVVYLVSPNHGYTTGQTVTARYVNGNTGANASGVITVISPAIFSIAGSVGTGAFTSGGIVWNSDLGEVGEVAVASGGAASGSVDTWRNTLDQNRNAWIINGAAIDVTTSGAGRPVLMYQALGTQDAQGTRNKFFNGNFFGVEPWVGVGVTFSGAVSAVGELRNVALAQVSTNGDVVPDSFDGHDWINVTDSYAGTGGVTAPGGMLWATT